MEIGNPLFALADIHNHCQFYYYYYYYHQREPIADDRNRAKFCIPRMKLHQHRVGHQHQHTIGIQ
jgi:hypothetical protein